MDDVVAAVAAHWEGRAATFDEEPDHGLRDPAVRDAWRARLASWLPPPPARVADLGCGTGSLAVLLATMGHEVTASDIAPAMVERARHKARTASVHVEVAVGDAAHPALPERSVDVVLIRHLAWTLPDPWGALDRWVALLRPAGRIVMIEGRWGTPTAVDEPANDEAADEEAEQGDDVWLRRALPWCQGVDAPTLLAVLDERFAHVEHHDLSAEPGLWGREVTDERYAVVAHDG